LMLNLNLAAVCKLINFIYLKLMLYSILERSSLILQYESLPISYKIYAVLELQPHTAVCELVTFSYKNHAVHELSSLILQYVSLSRFHIKLMLYMNLATSYCSMRAYHFLYIKLMLYMNLAA
jgi:hypothetical protein